MGRIVVFYEKALELKLGTPIEYFKGYPWDDSRGSGANPEDMQKILSHVYAQTGWPPLSSCNPGFLASAEGIILIDAPGRPADAVR